ncbi:hypothetical protein HY091_00265 [Candidatus Kaiserbacteria bacterium]|nr:hypothetical protein [Candidatus Kaiserbacteria bacterium]
MGAPSNVSALSAGEKIFFAVFAGALVLAVFAFEFVRPYLYLAPDSFTYFTMARQFHDTGLLFSYSGIDHTTGVHPGYYFFLMLLYPLFGHALPAWSFFINGLVLLAGIIVLSRAAGTVPAALVLLAAMTPYGVSLTNNGMESSLLFLGLSLFAAFFLRNPDAWSAGIDSRPTQAFLLGLILGGIVFSRLDAFFLVLGLYAVLFFKSGYASGWRVSWVQKMTRTFFFISLPLAAVLLIVFSMNFHYGGSILPVSGHLKSSFPSVSPGWFQNLLHLKTFALSVVVLGLYLLREFLKRRYLGILIPTLFLASLGLYLYNAFFVSDIGAWYGTLPFFSLSFVGALWLAEYIPRVTDFFRIHSSIFLPALFTVLCIAVVWAHVSFAGPNWISPHEDAARFLAAKAETGEAAGELKDGVFAFYASMPVYNLTGLANNAGYIDALRSGNISGYFEARRIRYVVGGTFGSGVQVSGSRIDFSACSDPIYDTGIVRIYGTASCFSGRL